MLFHCNSGCIHAPQCYVIQGDQKVSVHLTITVHSSGAQRLFDHPLHKLPLLFVCNIDCRVLNLSINCMYHLLQD